MTTNLLKHFFPLKERRLKAKKIFRFESNLYNKIAEKCLCSLTPFPPTEKPKAEKDSPEKR